MTDPVRCARGVCTNDSQGYVHRDTGRHYCATCARKINEWSPGLVVRSSAAGGATMETRA